MMTKLLTAFVGVVSIAANGQQKPTPSTHRNSLGCPLKLARWDALQSN
jgi:hypothetical protein